MTATIRVAKGLRHSLKTASFLKKRVYSIRQEASNLKQHPPVPFPVLLTYVFMLIRALIKHWHGAGGRKQCTSAEMTLIIVKRGTVSTLFCN